MTRFRLCWFAVLFVASSGLTGCGARSEDPSEDPLTDDTTIVTSGTQPDKNSGKATNPLPGLEGSDDGTGGDDDSDDGDAGSGDEAGDGDEAADEPTLSLSEPNGSNDSVVAGGDYTVHYAAAGFAGGAVVDLYYKADGAGCASGVPGWTALAAGLAASATTYVWDTATLPLGTYFVCGLLHDGEHADVFAVSPGTVTIEAVPFVTRWKTDNSGTSAADQITLPLAGGGTYNFAVDWGDGTSDTITSPGDAATTHTYASPGTYTVTMAGTITGFAFGGGGDAPKLLEVLSWGPLHLVDGGGYFAGATNLTITAPDVLNTTGITSMTSAFSGCSSLTGIPRVNDWDMSSVTATNWMFANSLFNSPIGDWDFGHVVTSEYMFMNDTPFNQDVSQWNTGSLVYAQVMFTSTSFDQDLSSWDIRHMYDMDHILQGTPFSTAHLDALLISWAAQAAEVNLQGSWFSTDAKYTPGGAAEAARTELVSTFHWAYGDGGSL